MYSFLKKLAVVVGATSLASVAWANSNCSFLLDHHGVTSATGTPGSAIESAAAYIVRVNSGFDSVSGAQVALGVALRNNSEKAEIVQAYDNSIRESENLCAQLERLVAHLGQKSGYHGIHGNPEKLSYLWNLENVTLYKAQVELKRLREERNRFVSQEVTPALQVSSGHAVLMESQNPFLHGDAAFIPESQQSAGILAEKVDESNLLLNATAGGKYVVPIQSKDGGRVDSIILNSKSMTEIFGTGVPSPSHKCSIRLKMATS